MSRSSFPARLARPIARALIAAVSLFLLATDANAHAHLLRTTPPVGGTVAPPSELRLEFSEGVEPRFSGVKLTSANGASVPLGPAKTEAGNAAVLIVPIGKPLPPGVYTVRWRAVSVDTHHTQGDFQFTVQP